MPTPILTLTTDFGLSDHYVGVMKAVMLSICRKAQLVDISHEVKPYQIAEGAYLIAQAYRHFPKKTVHVVVVDPGVGSERRPILMEAAGQYFVAPDNGVLSLICARQKYKSRILANPKYFCHPVSQTFHGRDIFAPVAAHLAAGIPPARIGKPINDLLRLPFDKPQPAGQHIWTGQILHIDRFGNIVTNFHADDFADALQAPFSLRLGRTKIATLLRTYAESRPNQLFAIFGSSGYLEISLNQSAASNLCGAGTLVEPIRLEISKRLREST